MRHLVPLALILLLMSAIVTPAWARTVAIESTVPLADDSEETLRSAIKKAIENAVRGAAALGLRGRRSGRWGSGDDDLTALARIAECSLPPPHFLQSSRLLATWPVLLVILGGRRTPCPPPRVHVHARCDPRV